MVSVPLEQRWRSLLRELRPEFPPPDMRLYVKPGHGCADEVVRDFLADPTACPKFLLVGPKGGGKSTELRAISAALKGKAGLVEIDLDRSGVTPSAISAYDLLYISALALLGRLGREDATPLFQELSLRYAGGDREAQQGLGDLSTALGGVATFAGAATALATTVGLATGVAPVAGATAALASQGLRLLGRTFGVVAESSPQGRSLQEIAERIARTVRDKENNLPICVLIDGLEKMNGEALERFRQVFEQTRLLADTRWAAVIAAPPSTLTETSSVDGRGFYTKPVWGFGPDHLPSLRELLARRFQDANFDPEREVVQNGLLLIAEKSGGLPRHAIMIARAAAIRAMDEKSPTLTQKHIDAGINDVAQSLGRGLTAEHIQILQIVAKTARLPKGERAGSLYADGRILAYPPVPPSAIPRFVVHPLLHLDIASEPEPDLTFA
jgi:energy-coupling factor transporter ATP-binding protein EcfA2